jgi:aspartyl-tRNA(Asn)/glutamyl-tRNA(Gln) amidotransferase subunit A
MTIRALGDALRAGSTSSRELTAGALERAHALDDELHAFITLDDEGALAAADRADAELRAGTDRGPLHGIPIGVKDNLDTRGLRTTFGSAAHRDHVPQADAEAVGRAAAAGAVSIGKQNLHEFALGVTSVNPHFGTVGNPRVPGRIAGGSSGGGAASVAAGIVPASIGSDTSGSIRIPAACCGVVGFKPTFGAVPTRGCFPEAASLDTVGPLAGSVEDAELMFRALASGSLEPGPTTARPADVGPVRIGIESDFFLHDVDAAILRAVRSFLDALDPAGFELRDVTIPHIGEATEALTVTDIAETTALHQRTLRERPEVFGEDVRALIEEGFGPTAVQYVDAQATRAVLAEEFARAFEDVDVIVSPTLPIPVPEVDGTVGLLDGEEVDGIAALMRLIGPANLVGLPALSIPIGVVDGLPVGLQVIGGRGQDLGVLAAGRALETVVSAVGSVGACGRRRWAQLR